MKAKVEPVRRTAVDVAPSAPRGRLAALAMHPTLRVALVGALLMWAALPPLAIGALGWIAPVPWLWLARRRELRGRRPYLAIWFAAFVFWLGALHWLRLPHWATSFGWVALSFYMALYTPLLVGLCRFAARRFGVSIVVSAPIVWTACDQARAYVMTGFSMGSLSHTQYRWTAIIQSADLWGEFGVTFCMVLVAAAMSRALPIRDEAGHATWAPKWFAVAGGVVALMLVYGEWKLLGSQLNNSKPGDVRSLKIALIQGSIDTEMKHDPTAHERIYEHYLALSQLAVAADPTVEIVVWPETMFPYPTWTWSDDASPAPGDPWTKDLLVERAGDFQNQIRLTAETLRKPLLIGIGATRFLHGAALHWNSALYTDAHGRHLGRYDKRHPVVFGEYTPFAKQIPLLYALTPLTGGIEEGARAEAFDLGGVQLVPSICYESVLARVIRRQVVELRAKGIEPDVLVNVTNDGWFWGSSELDMHLICGVFRAVENRKPLVIAANTGFSAHIDADGHIVQQGPRRETSFLNANVVLDRRHSVYSRWGDWLANGCLGLTTVAVVLMVVESRRRNALAVT